MLRKDYSEPFERILSSIEFILVWLHLSCNDDKTTQVELKCLPPREINYSWKVVFKKHGFLYLFVLFKASIGTKLSYIR